VAAAHRIFRRVTPRDPARRLRPPSPGPHGRAAADPLSRAPAAAL